ncbi:MAG: hypothetical protein F6K50_50800 [Moorea sp. SIO3I7]|uniref:Uncharacterized protein n=1 Tax=Moorena bouillonii PNG TaxID=568701 RepID=A0A1U7MV77_9CYAN|nr:MULTISPECIES: hypothetical protein [Moorena]NEO03312.1 hypothetical protein [Moorena sp. SIO3I7]NEO64243.1 hypothetical protein [Moorena sp. SIO4G2]NEO10556.1 hypothetical protein [Moorena sp. SIO3I8]NEP28352.1 hypothetical protein [Moorena sp. SIO3I6]NEQ62490.1 hypothetical protein [Moorena sp. SIO4A1]
MTLTTDPEPNHNQYPEPTLTDVIRKLDELSDEVKKFDERFSNYQQATQWVIQLAFGLIASATVIVIVSNVLN